MYTSVDRETFLADRMRQDAVIRKLEIIGEAVKRLSDNSGADGLRFRGSRLPACEIV
jgi:uncharacterized protein with HEPN domain